MPGNLRQVFQSPVGEVDFQWQDQFGGVARIQGPFGVSHRHPSYRRRVSILSHAMKSDFKIVHSLPRSRPIAG